MRRTTSIWTIPIVAVASLAATFILGCGANSESGTEPESGAPASAVPEERGDQ